MSPLKGLLLEILPILTKVLSRYGNTADYAAMIKDLVRRFPATKVSLRFMFKKTSASATKYAQNNVLFDVTTFQGDICRVLHGWESHHKGDFSFSRHITKHLIFIRTESYMLMKCNALK